MDDVNQQLSEVKDSLKDCRTALNRFDDHSYFQNHKSFRYLKDDPPNKRRETLEIEKEHLRQKELLLLQQKILTEESSIPFSPIPPSSPRDPLNVLAPAKGQQPSLLELAGNAAYPQPPMPGDTTAGNQSQLAEIVSSLGNLHLKLDGMNTVSMDMSKATKDFTDSLLRSVGVTYFTLPHCNETGDAIFQAYQWGRKESEEIGQQGCKSLLEAHLLPWKINKRQMGLHDVRNTKLPVLDFNRYRSAGFSHLAIGDHESMIVPANEDLIVNYALCLIELKTAKAKLNNNQLLLQLCSIAQSSNVRAGVVVLGTDCDKKWRLMYFSAENTIDIRTYSCGGKCLEDLKKLVSSGDVRWKKIEGSGVVSIPENEVSKIGSESDVESQEHHLSANALQNFALKLKRMYPDSGSDEIATTGKPEVAGPPSMIYM